MKLWLRALVLYAPGLALFVAGIVLLVGTPVGSTPPCTCYTGPNGTVCPPCAPVSTPAPFGLLLLVASGLYALSAFLVRLTIRWNPPSRT